MDPIEKEEHNFTYKGPSPDVGDLTGIRNDDGSFTSHWRPSPEELEGMADAIQNGDFAIELTIHSSPIPPVSMSVVAV